jgi:hypothetical protein
MGISKLIMMPVTINIKTEGIFVFFDRILNKCESTKMIDAAMICTYELLKSRAPESINIGFNVISERQDRKWIRSNDDNIGLK